MKPTLLFLRNLGLTSLLAILTALAVTYLVDPTGTERILQDVRDLLVYLSLLR